MWESIMGMGGAKVMMALLLLLCVCEILVMLMSWLGTYLTQYLLPQGKVGIGQCRVKVGYVRYLNHGR
jgi:hypothetical protein